MTNPLLRCFALYRSQAGRFGLASALVLLVNLCLPLAQYLQGLAIHDLELGRAIVHRSDGTWNMGRAWMWAGLLLGIIMLGRSLQYFASVASIAVGQRLLTQLRGRLFGRIQELDASYHRLHGAGELITRTTRDSDKVRDALTGGMRTLLELLATVLGSLGVLLYYNWLLALVPAVLILAAIGMGIARSGELVRLNRASDQAYDRVAQDLSEGIHGVRVIKAFTLERSAIGRFQANIAVFKGVARAAASFTLSRVPGPQILVALGHPWILGYGAWLVAHDSFNVAHGGFNRGELIAAVMLMQSVVFRVEGIGRLLQVFADAQASAVRVMEILDAETTVVGGTGILPPPPVGMRLEQVTVRSPSGAMVLDRVDLTLVPGEIVALVGMTGCGKTTLATLLPRLRDPDAGRVLLGGDGRWQDVRTLPLDALRRTVQLVSQESFLFSDSLAANLRMAAPEADEAALRAALIAAAAQDVLAGLPDGLTSRIGERGVTLSGGQRQRVCIARALLAAPTVLILDDATSALDAITERRILAELRSGSGAGSGRCAVLLITSRLSSIKCCDRVLHLDGGRIAASGTHAQLVERSASYRDQLGIDPGDAA